MHTSGEAPRSHPSCAPLYAHILRDDWLQVAAPIRRAHAPLPVLRAHGHFRVAHGRHPMARLIARLLRLPPACDAIDTWLIVTALAQGERWERTFGTSRVLTEQYAGPACDLIECFGLLEFCFHLDATDGSLRYVQREAACRWRSARWRLPAWLAPRVDAREDAVGLDAVKVDVRITLPMVGQLMTYDGLVEVEVEVGVDGKDTRA